MKNLIFVLGVLAFSLKGKASHGSDGITPSHVSVFHNWLSNHAFYPSEAVSTKQEGTVYVSFAVTSEGVVSDIQIEEGVSEALNKAALTLVENMPVSQLVGGQEIVAGTYIVPIKFEIK